MMKKLFALFVAVATVASVQTAHVQADAPADIYVRNILITKNTYAAGDTVKGTFQLINGNTTVGVPDVVYEVSLGGGYKNGVVGTIYDTKTFPAVFLDAGEKKNVPFSYTLPKTFSGTDMDIHIQAYLKSGTPLGWADFPIKVTGGLQLLNITRAAVQIDKTEFNVGAGPMIYPGTTSTSTLNLAVSNPATGDLALTPHIKIYNRSTTGTLLKEYDAAPLTVKSKSKANVSYPLDTMNNTPGVYLGEIVYNDAQGTARSIAVDYRYIVAGNIVTFTSMTTGKDTVAKGDLLPITVNFTGSPYDISTETNGAGNGDTAIFDLKVYNEHDELVGEYTDTTDFNANTSKIVPLTAAVAAKALRADVTATKNGKILASYSVKLTSNYDQAKLEAVNTPANNRMRDIAYGIAAVIIAIILIALILKLANRRKMTALMILFALVFAATCSTAQAYTESSRKSINSLWDYTSNDFVGFFTGSYPGYYPPYNGSMPDSSRTGNEPQGYTGQDGAHWHISGCQNNNCTDFSPSVTINSPGSIDTFAPDTQFTLDGIASAEACENNPQTIKVTASFNGGPDKVFTKDNANNFDPNSGHSLTRGSASFSIGTFTTPHDPGTYTLTFRVDNYTNTVHPDDNTNQFLKKHPGGTLDPATFGGYVIGTINIVVRGQAPVVSLMADPTHVTYNNQQSTLSWNLQNNPASCSAGGGWSGPIVTTPTTGSQPVGPLKVGTQYTLTCTNAYGTGSNSVTVSVDSCTSNNNPPPSDTGTPPTDTGTPPTDTGTPPGGTDGGQSLNTIGHATSQAASVILAQTDPCATPLVSLYAADDTVDYNATTVLTWHSTDVDICTGTNFSTGDAVDNSSGLTTSPLTSDTTFSISCHNNTSGADVGSQVTVHVRPQVQDFTATCKPTTPGHASPKDTVTGTLVTWTTNVVPSGTYTYAWSGDDGLSGTNSTAPITYATVGLKHAQVVITGGGTSHTVTCTNSPFPVKPAPIFQEI